MENEAANNPICVIIWGFHTCCQSHGSSVISPSSDQAHGGSSFTATKPGDFSDHRTNSVTSSPHLSVSQYFKEQYSCIQTQLKTSWMFIEVSREKIKSDWGLNVQKVGWEYSIILDGLLLSTVMASHTYLPWRCLKG